MQVLRSPAVLDVLARPELSRAMARVADLELPAPLLRAMIAAYIRMYRVDMTEAVVPAAGFRTFNDFFVRRLLPGTRPVAEARLVSPADARLIAIGRIREDGRVLDVKGRDYAVGELCGDEARAHELQGGVMATLYLSPRDYHRVHSPVAGRITGWCYAPGKLYPVNPDLDPGRGPVFPQNERVSIFLETATGPVVVVMVGANNVGRISLSFAPVVTNQGRPGELAGPAAAIPVSAGDELGAFNLGSSVVVLAGDAGLQATVAAGTFLRVGQPLWR
jgi:phosphatidylserine decarboxylase